MIPSGVRFVKSILFLLHQTIVCVGGVLIRHCWGTSPPQVYQVIKIDGSLCDTHYLAERGLYEGVKIKYFQRDMIMVLDSHLLVRLPISAKLTVKKL